MAKKMIKVPDIGADKVDVIEVCVAPGDTIAKDDSLLVLESDKASMDVPSPFAGKILSVLVKEGDTASEGDEIAEIEVAGPEVEESAAATPENTAVAQEPSPNKLSPNKPSPEKPSPNNPSPGKPSEKSAQLKTIQVTVPDIGSESVDLIEVCVAVGDDVEENDSLVVLESDKASMEIPSPAQGKVISIHVKEGDKLGEGDAVLVLESANAVPASGDSAIIANQNSAASKKANPEREQLIDKPATSNELLPIEIESAGSEVYAGPAVRKLARQLGVELSAVRATGPRKRVTQDDVKLYVKTALQSPSGATNGAGVPAVPAVDFAQFGDITLQKMSKIKKLTAANMSRNWLNAPHVTQFDDADITELEDFRKKMKAEAEKSGIKLTPLPFILKACAAAMKLETSLNVSLHADGEHIVQKQYVHIGVAVDTPKGLVVPVIRDVDKKGLYELAGESVSLAGKARAGKLLPREMQGGCFTVSSLGPIGGKGFTPIVNVPEVAILGVSKASVQPVWNGSEFLPRTMLPLCLSYDHRAINGAEAGRFLTYLVGVLGDIRKLLV